MESKDTGGGCRVYRRVSLSTQKLHLNAESILQPTLFLGCHQYKSCCVSTSVEVILSAVEILSNSEVSRVRARLLYIHEIQCGKTHAIFYCGRMFVRVTSEYIV